MSDSVGHNPDLVALRDIVRRATTPEAVLELVRALATLEGPREALYDAEPETEVEGATALWRLLGAEAPVLDAAVVGALLERSSGAMGLAHNPGAGAPWVVAALVRWVADREGFLEAGPRSVMATLAQRGLLRRDDEALNLLWGHAAARKGGMWEERAAYAQACLLALPDLSPEDLLALVRHRAFRHPELAWAHPGISNEGRVAVLSRLRGQGALLEDMRADLMVTSSPEVLAAWLGQAGRSGLETQSLANLLQGLGVEAVAAMLMALLEEWPEVVPDTLGMLTRGQCRAIPSPVGALMLAHADPDVRGAALRFWAGSV